ncbi:VOC family protein [Paenibacillus filicis]|uniref:VOC family protein n=1 Tax=Paenibacillus gyeongsangnamensis TaxID=3388067 RepID=A0ABT4QIF9_9BACL|nr:VOC family protein [Paenibacillus filicis]MCZ8516654.1 VOC family protein [Paenibacillus filicis]
MSGVHPATQIGHVHLKVSDLERSIRFYTGVLSFDLVNRLGNSIAFLSFGGYHHHLVLNTLESAGGRPPGPGTTGLLHFAILYPSQRELGRALKRLPAHGVQLDSAVDHGVSFALYLHNPDWIGIELTCDRDPSEWTRTPDGRLAIGEFNASLDLRSLLAAAE